jgi:hypothetical protein
MMVWLFVNAGLLATYGKVPYPGQFPSAAESISITGRPAKAVIACTYLFVASYAPTWGPVSWIYPPELYPLRVRGKAVALATSANWWFFLLKYKRFVRRITYYFSRAFNFALAYFVPPAFANIRWEVYIVFGVFCAAMFIHVFFLFPETAQKPLEEVDYIFDDTTPGSFKYLGTPAWKTHVDKDTVRMERGEISDEKFAPRASHAESPERKEAVPQTSV